MRCADAGPFDGNALLSRHSAICPNGEAAEFFDGNPSAPIRACSRWLTTDRQVLSREMRGRSFRGTVVGPGRPYAVRFLRASH